MKAVLLPAAVKKDLQTRFKDGDLTSLQTSYFISIIIDTGDIIARFGKAGASDQSNISGSNYSDLHRGAKIAISWEEQEVGGSPQSSVLSRQSWNSRDYNCPRL